LISKNDDLLDHVFIELMQDKYGHYYTREIPEEMKKGLLAFKNVFKNAPTDYILEVLKEKD